MLVVAYFTFGTPYADEARRLEASLRDHRLDYEIASVPAFGSWQKATQYKPRFLLDMWQRHGTQPLLYLDADAIVVQDPRPYLDQHCPQGSVDLAVHYLNDAELISATILINPTPIVPHLMEKWIHLADAHPQVWDQKLLATAIDATPGVRVHRLPPEFNWIDAGDPKRPVDISEKYYGQRVPVIRQTQASRRYKAVVTRGVC